MSDKQKKVKVLKGVLVAGLDTIEVGGEVVIDAREAEALVAAEIVEIVGDAPAKKAADAPAKKADDKGGKEEL